MKYLSKHVATWLIRCGAIDEMDRELYEYAVYSLIFLIAPLAIILTFGIMMDRVLESIIIIIPFMCVRKFSGGFHAKHVWVCILCSCSVLFMCVYMVTNIKYIFVLNICVVLAVTSLIILSPIDSESRKLYEGEIVKYKKVTAAISLVFGGLYCVCLLTDNIIYAICIAEGIMLPACLQIPCILLKLKSKEKLGESYNWKILKNPLLKQRIFFCW